MAYPNFWTDEKIKLLRKYVIDEELSFSQVAQKLKCSRNAALAKAYRMGIKAPDKPKQKNDKYKAKEPVKSKPKKPPKSKIKEQIHTPAPVNKGKRNRTRLPASLKSDKQFFKHIEELKPRSSNITNIPGEYSCHWISGDVLQGDATWCRKPATCGTKWCKKHYGLVYQSSADKERGKRWREYMGTHKNRKMR